MKILILGDLMGNSPRKTLQENLSKIIDDKKIDFDLIVTTKDIQIEKYHVLNFTSGIYPFQVVFPEDTSNLAEVIVRINSIDDGFEIKQFDPEIVTFPVKVIPEFATLSLIVMTLSFITVLTIQRFKNFVRLQQF